MDSKIETLTSPSILNLYEGSGNMSSFPNDIDEETFLQMKEIMHNEISWIA